jgi:hypothetical protein
MAKVTPRTIEKVKPPTASINVIIEWLPKIGSFSIKAVHKSRGGGNIKEGTWMISTKTSHRTKSAAKKITGSMMLLKEDFTCSLRS